MPSDEQQAHWEIDFRNDQQCAVVDLGQLRRALLTALQAEQVASAVLSVCLVDNAEIHRLNRVHLQHDYPTDVISFQLDFTAGPEAGIQSLRARGAAIEGEIIASVQMAAELAGDGDWSPQSELTLYLIHGLLHICGYDDLTADEQSAMRVRERTILGLLGLNVVYAEEKSAAGLASDIPGSETSEDLS